MNYVIEVLEKERKLLEKSIRDEDMLRGNMRKATQYLKQINELKRAIKVLRTKIRVQA